MKRGPEEHATAPGGEGATVAGGAVPVGGSQGTQDAVHPDRGLIELLYQLADDELVIGHRASEWTGVAPHIEEDVAFSSIAQDEVGHAALFYQLLAGLGEGGGDPDRIAFGRLPEAFRNATLLEQPNGDWADEIARHFLYSEYEAVLLPRLALSPYRPLAEAAARVAREETYHRAHFQSWLERLARAGGEARARMERSLRRAYVMAAGLFEAGPAEEETARWRGCGLGEVRAEWEDAVRRRCEDLGLAVPSGVPAFPAAPAAEPGAAAVGGPVGSGQRAAAAAGPFGGRHGRHGPALAALVDELTEVYRLDPAATW